MQRLPVTTACALHDGGSITLEGLAPATIYFSDRPHRLAGHLTTAEFVELWKEGVESFAADPPNAALSLLSEDYQEPAVIELRSVALEGENLKYEVRLLDGTLPEKAGPVTLFIDPWVYVPPRRFGPAWRPWRNCYWSFYLHRRYCRRVY